MSVLSQLVDVSPWVGVFLAAVVAVFLIYVGVTLCVALFHPDATRGERARVILVDLLDFFRRRPRR